MSEYSVYKHGDKAMMKRFIDCPDVFRMVCISDRQLEIIRAMKEIFNNAMLSSDLRDYLGCSIQSASTQLTKLWYTGYIERRTIVDDSGGIKHVYRSVI